MYRSNIFAVAPNEQPPSQRVGSPVPPSVKASDSWREKERYLSALAPKREAHCPGNASRNGPKRYLARQTEATRGTCAATIVAMSVGLVLHMYLRAIQLLCPRPYSARPLWGGRNGGGAGRLQAQGHMNHLQDVRRHTSNSLRK